MQRDVCDISDSLVAAEEYGALEVPGFGCVLAGYREQARDAVEEKVLALQERKAELAAGILSDDYRVDVKFGTDDLAALFEPLPD